MQVTFTGEPHEIMQQYAAWFKTLDFEQKLLYNKIIITGNKADKVKLSDYKKVIQQIAINNRGGIKTIDKEIMTCYNVEKKRFSNGFFITGIKIKQ
ncbi:kinase [Enterococcus phage vb_GEC_Ef_S_9]|nr:kinase [Enterococcus phage vb_GEC_Ef_S_9]